MIKTTLIPGTLVKFEDPQNESEQFEVFKVIEDRDSRVLVESTVYCLDWAIKPNTVHFKEDLILA